MDYKFPYNKEKEQNKIEMKGSVPMNYAEVINDDIEREKNIEKAFKEKNKETNEFIKKNDKRETEKVKSKDLKKMHLEESLFEDAEESNNIDEALDENPIIAWLGEHEQAWEDFTAHFSERDIESLSDEEIIEWISEHEKLYADYKKYFNKQCCN